MGDNGNINPTVVLSALIFRGDLARAERRKDDLSASDFVKEIGRRKAQLGWSDDQTMTHVKGAMRDGAAIWLNDLLPSTMLPEEYNRITSEWGPFMEQFAKTYDVEETTLSEVSWAKMAHQQPEETIVSYFGRLAVNLNKVNNHIKPDVRRLGPDPIDPELLALTPRVAATEAMYARIEAAQAAKLERQITEVWLKQTSGYIKYIAVGGIADRQVAMHAQRNIKTPDFAAFHTLVALEIKNQAQHKEPRASRSSANGHGNGAQGNGNGYNHKNGKNGNGSRHGKVHEVEDQGDEVDAVMRKRANRPKCSHCNMNGHVVKDCYLKVGNGDVAKGKAIVTARKDKDKKKPPHHVKAVDAEQADDEGDQSKQHWASAVFARSGNANGF